MKSFPQVCGLNGFLLSARCAVDDIPMGFYANRAAAEEAAADISPQDVALCADIVYGIPRTTKLEAYCLQVTFFVRGMPQRGAEIIRHFYRDEPQQTEETDVIPFCKKNRPDYSTLETGGQ